MFAHAWPASPEPLLVSCFVIGPRILISRSGCSPPGLKWGQIARLFISLAINISRCTAAFSGNNRDNGTTALLSPFLSFSSPCHFCEQQAHSFISRPFGISLLFFPPLPNLISSVLNGTIFRLWLPSRMAP